jgi:hypothetical protein
VPARRSSKVRSIAAWAVSPSNLIVFGEQVPEILYVIARYHSLHRDIGKFGAGRRIVNGRYRTGAN